ncbi:MAG: T9SS type A sorting domain-containing protein [Bacteroidetes bacterium]|nr:MAG: T9SS type A sorting domain-containing protein [Bacteroidota bacterium]
MARILLISLFLVFTIQTLQAQCQPFETTVRLEIDPDQFWGEISWKFVDLNSGFVFAEGQPSSADPQVFEYCITQGICVVFTISDAHGDGMDPDGSFKLFLDDQLYFEYDGYNFGYEENVTFGCPPGGFCTNPLDIGLGNHTTINGYEIWYSFTPQDTGTYRISTCEAQLDCPTKIWVYDICQGITVTNDNTGATFYADGGCPANPNGAQAELYLAAGTEYYIRLGYANGICNGQGFDFSLEYIGPVIGCTDSLACNYQPLATVSDTCIYPGDPDCTDLPDLIVLENVLRSTLMPDYLISNDPCYVDEGCVSGFGTRYILRFSTYIKNIGVADYYIGTPPSNPNTPSDQFVWDACHNHWHYRGYAEYILFDENGVLLPIGSKNGFCILDLACDNGGLGKYSCGNMGISAGCGDVYDNSIDCQWVDLTGLNAGFYTLVVRVNWDKSPDKTGRKEATYDNNWAQACFELKYDADGDPEIEEMNDCPTYTDCFGEVFGSAQPDCSGACGGALLHGDWNQDTLQELSDIEQYLAASLGGFGDPTTCFDLDEDGNIDIYDAALLQECVLHTDDVQYWGTRYACRFPGGIDNPDDIVYLLPGSLDTVNKTFDVRIVNPFNKLYGFEFEVKGLTISGVENLDTTFAGTWEFNSQNKIQALSTEETGLKRNILPGDLIRIHYSKLTAPEVCLGEIYNIVNEKYHRANALVADPACVLTGITSTFSQEELPEVFVMPNPARDFFTVFIGGNRPDAVSLKLFNTAGQVVWASPRSEQPGIRVPRGNLHAGVYFLTIQSPQGIQQVRIIFN